MTLLRAFTLALLLAAPGLARAGDPPAAVPVPATATAPAVDLVICLDTSGSMEGLIDACRRKLWDVCALVAQARPSPLLRVALLTYGGTTQPAADGWVTVDVPFTTDLDRVYERLMALGTSGGTEYVGRVVQTALDKLTWSDDHGALRVLFVAGNESADQDPVCRAADVCRAAHERGVTVHAVYCGADADAGEPAGWREVARAGGGQYASIDQQGTVSVPTPFDEPMSRLSAELNTTYLPFGQDGQRGCQNQTAQDGNSSSLGGSVAASRAEAKASGVYRNGSWDLVDARLAEGFDWAKLDGQELPEALRGLTPAERDAVLSGLRSRRQALSAQIVQLSKQRQAFVAAELAKHQDAAARSLDTVLLGAVRAQAEAHGLRFE